MSGYLPYGVFNWLKNVDNFHVNSVSENTSTGYHFEIDLEYPEKLHLLHNSYPLAPEKLPILMTCCQIFVKKLQTNME